MTLDPGGSIVHRMLMGAGWMMGWRVISRSLGFVSMLILAHFLMPSDFGVVAVATAISASIDSLSRLGVRDALVRLHHERRDYYDTAFTFQVGRGVLTSLLLAGCSLFAQKLFGDARLKGILLLMAAFAVVSGCENIGVVLFSRALNFRIQFLMQIAPRLIGFVVTTALAFVLRDYHALIWGMGMNSFAGVAVSYMASAYRPRFGLTGWRYLLGFSFWSWAGGLALMVWSRADVFLLAPVLGTAALGIYLLAGEIAAMPVTELVEPAAATLTPGFAMAQRNGSASVSMGLTVGGILALGTVPFAIGVSACSGYLIAGLLGPQWQAARPLIAVMSWGCMFSPFAYVSGGVLTAHGKVRRVFVSSAMAAVFKVVVVLLVRETQDLMMISAAAVAAVAAESGIFIVQLRAAGGRGEMRQLGMAMTRATLSTAATCALLWLLPGTWDNVALDRITALVAGASIGLLSFVVFFACQLLLWRMSGRPDGAEARLIEALRGVVRQAGWPKSLRTKVQA